MVTPWNKWFKFTKLMLQYLLLKFYDTFYLNNQNIMKVIKACLI